MKKEKTSRPVANKIKTEIWADIHHQSEEKLDNEITLCRGYDFYNDLLGRYSWLELFFLQLRGDMPSKKESSILNIVMSSIINPGPRDWATQAAMTAAVAKTTVGNSLISGLSVLQGRYHGALCVENAINMFQDADSIAAKNESLPKAISILQEKYPDLPGYGLYYSERDKRAIRLIELVKEEVGQGKYLTLALEIEKKVSREKGIWLTIAGAVAAVLTDLRFTPREGHGIFLISAAPGILAHLLEQMKGDWNLYPFYEPPEYDGSRDMRLKNNQKIYGE